MEIQNDITAKTLAHAATKATGDDMKRISAAATLGLLRVVLVDDPDYDFDNLCGDLYNPKVNTRIDKDELNRQKRAFRARVNREGVYGSLIQCRSIPTGEWETIESIWGMVGEDFIGSGYDIDFLSVANDWLFSNLDLPKIQSALSDLL